MKVKIEAARALLHRCAWCWDNKYEYDPRQGMLIKGYIDDVAVSVVNHAVSIYAGVATADKDLPIQKYLRDIYTCIHGFATTRLP